jgi:hypothetical protein
MAVVTTAAIILALKAAHDVAKDARDCNDPDRMRDAVHNLSRMLSDSISNMLSLQARITDLEKQADGIAAQQIWRFTSRDEKKRFVRQRSEGGDFVYVDRDLAHAPGLAPHYCAGCFETGTRATLRPMGVGGYAKCPACGATPCTGR